MPIAQKEVQSHANYDVLIRLEESMTGMRGSFEKFTVEQEIENKRIHSRIDATQEKFLLTFTTLKDGMAEKGRITPAFVAIVLSLLTTSGWVCSRYIDMQVAPLNGAIELNLENLSEAHRVQAILATKLQEVAVGTAVADAKAEQDRKWITKLLDEERLNHKTKQP